jgi:hypothetical protein
MIEIDYEELKYLYMAFLVRGVKIRKTLVGDLEISKSRRGTYGEYDLRQAWRFLLCNNYIARVDHELL